MILGASVPAGWTHQVLVPGVLFGPQWGAFLPWSQGVPVEVWVGPSWQAGLSWERLSVLLLHPKSSQYPRVRLGCQLQKWGVAGTLTPHPTPQVSQAGGKPHGTGEEETQL